MSKAEKYQRFAEACLEIASAAKDDKIIREEQVGGEGAIALPLAKNVGRETS
jgi:hypothetical protein